MVDTDEERTPLQQKLDEFAQQLSKVLCPYIHMFVFAHIYFQILGTMMLFLEI